MKERSSRSSTRARLSLGRRVGRQLRAAGTAGRDAVRNPASIPGAAGGFFRRWFRRLWNARGGGLYAFGYAVTFIWLEIRTLAGDFVDSDSVADFLTSEILEFLLRFATDTIVNMAQSFVWPVFVLEFYPPWGLIGLLVAFLAFPRYVKRPLERWVADDEEATDEDHTGA